MSAIRLVPLTLEQHVQRIAVFCRAGWLLVRKAGREGFEFVWPSPPAPKPGPCAQRVVTLHQIQAAEAAGLTVQGTMSLTTNLFGADEVPGWRARGQS